MTTRWSSMLTPVSAIISPIHKASWRVLPRSFSFFERAMPKAVIPRTILLATGSLFLGISTSDMDPETEEQEEEKDAMQNLGALFLVNSAMLGIGIFLFQRVVLHTMLYNSGGRTLTTIALFTCLDCVLACGINAWIGEPPMTNFWKGLNLDLWVSPIYVIWGTSACFVAAYFFTLPNMLKLYADIDLGKSLPTVESFTGDTFTSEGVEADIDTPRTLYSFRLRY